LVQRIQALPLPNHPLVGSGLMAPIQVTSLPMPSTSTQPYECSIVYDRRLVPGETLDGILDEYQRGLAGLDNWSVEVAQEGYQTYTGVELRSADFHPGWALEPASEWQSEAMKALTSAGLEPETFIAPYCTNGSASGGERGIPTLIFGPSGIEQAHIVDESLEIAELLRGAAGYAALAKGLT
ncbi:MAG TPA: YgeY family selenium metabolism-linked hydrolase, partial [Phycisphaerales bacterium]|nr:YgeY family selenium metabolism-linked hydrolase [Phycisphaerales bacterium]